MSWVAAVVVTPPVCLGGLWWLMRVDRRAFHRAPPERLPARREAASGGMVIDGKTALAIVEAAAREYHEMTRP